MEMPNVLYRGEFRPQGNVRDISNGIVPSQGRISASQYVEWATYYAAIHRLIDKDLPGTWTMYRIDTGKLPQEVRASALPPDAPDELINDITTREERIQMGEWMLSRITKESISILEQRQEDAKPDMTIHDVREYRPKPTLPTLQAKT